MPPTAREAAPYRDFYEAVADDPQVAVLDAECEGMCYFFAHLYRERFGEFPVTGSGISGNHVRTLPAGPADPAPDRAVQNAC